MMLQIFACFSTLSRLWYCCHHTRSENALSDAFFLIQISGKGIRLSEELEDSLVDAFKNHIAPFYELAPAEALSVAAASANYIFERKVRDKLPKRMREGHNLLDTEIVRWQQIIDRGILSGILVGASRPFPVLRSQSPGLCRVVVS
ncbi:uncharacterized protein EI90DRAFT_2120301 [Cantharellus anzutake]|uniref:uncharacterized protein n=1 Tax=Cantharellus anzutake TaxID=1750568 RepID=UPI001907391A|nr:uncharacterized protein EI90DRAFT_2120301 [Cantharellus anzutake]KAF8325544.1 hypothetical protein EI90DRAFT_2120301 [Cantharellus anzutake]